MSAERQSPASRPRAFDPSILDRLACPVCIGALRLVDSCLQCEGCGRAYPVVEGIPVLIAERAAGPKDGSR